jgi:hypothetical protein
VVASALGLLLVGCGPKPAPPYVAAYSDAPKQAHCFDGVPHIAGSKPWALGGTCCCTPSDALMAKLHADGICTNMDAEALKALYHEKGIQVATDHSGCNNLCKYGPHVTRGGKCMVPPQPGTRNYQEIVTGVVLVPASQPARK